MQFAEEKWGAHAPSRALSGAPAGQSGKHQGRLPAGCGRKSRAFKGLYPMTSNWLMRLKIW